MKSRNTVWLLTLLKKTSVLLIMSVLIFTTTSHSQGEKCLLWSSGWFDAKTVQKKYGTVAQSVCDEIESAYKMKYNSSIILKARYVNSDLWMCDLYDAEDNYKTVYTQVNRVERDLICENFVMGPYSMLSDVWTMKIKTKRSGGTTLSVPMGYRLRGRVFDGQQKEDILTVNSPDNGLTYVSDLWSIPELADIDDGCGGKLTEDNPDLGCRPEVHHIIPAKDRLGCDCGRNSSKNALVISRRLNGDLSNNFNDPRLLRIIEYFSIMPTFSENDVVEVRTNLKIPKAKKEIRLKTKKEAKTTKIKTNKK